MGKALHRVSARATGCSPSLGQVAAGGTSNEITAIPRLRDLRDLKGALVTPDAMGCQKGIAAKVVEGGGDQVLTAKDNQPQLLGDIRACSERALGTDFAGAGHDS